MTSDKIWGFFKEEVNPGNIYYESKSKDVVFCGRFLVMAVYGNPLHLSCQIYHLFAPIKRTFLNLFTEGINQVLNLSIAKFVLMLLL